MLVQCQSAWCMRLMAIGCEVRNKPAAGIWQVTLGNAALNMETHQQAPAGGQSHRAKLAAKSMALATYS